jgi:hypothetical protein
MDITELQRRAGITEDLLNEDQYADAAMQFKQALLVYMQSVERKLTRGDIKGAFSLLQAMNGWTGVAIAVHDDIEMIHNFQVRKNDPQAAIQHVQQSIAKLKS